MNSLKINTNCIELWANENGEPRNSATFSATHKDSSKNIHRHVYFDTDPKVYNKQFCYEFLLVIANQWK